MPNADELEEKLERLKLESSIENTKLDIEKFRAMQTELQKKYGKGWRRKLGLKSGKKNLNDRVTMENMANLRFMPIESPTRLTNSRTSPISVPVQSLQGSGQEVR